MADTDSIQNLNDSTPSTSGTDSKVVDITKLENDLRATSGRLQAEQKRNADLLREKDTIVGQTQKEREEIAKEARLHKENLEKLQLDYANAQDELAKVKIENAKLAAEKTSQSLIKKYAPALAAISDDLRQRGDFENDDTYATYLKRMEETLVKGKTNFALGATPSAPALGAPSAGSLPSVEQITAQLMGLNPARKEDQQKYIELNKQLNDAMKSVAAQRAGRQL